MVLDFGEIKDELMKRVHDKYDHGFIVFQNDFDMVRAFGYAHQDWKIVTVPFVPTAENLAKSIYDDLKDVFPSLAYVQVFETPTSVAGYPV
jgi:6-pyruvoyltetrahydropterin/6-carboxytetrahydropterin synthase